MTARLLKPAKVVVREYHSITHTELKKLLAARKQKKYGFKEVAYEVEDLGLHGPDEFKRYTNRYNVRMEYIA